MESVLSQAPVKSSARSRTNLIKFIVVVTTFVGIAAYLLINTFQSNAVYYYSLSEMNAQRALLIGRTVRLNGALDRASIRNGPKNLVLKFNMVEPGHLQPIVYHGVVPDTMGIAENVVAEGKLDANGVFQAQTLLFKCPSKYEESPVQ